MKQSPTQLLAVLSAFFSAAQSSAIPRADKGSCKKTKVAILGAGVAGIAAAQNLTDAKITDYIIVEHNDYIGGRLRKHSFGKNSTTNKPFTIELGANWIEGLGSAKTHENPIYELAKKHKIKSTFADYDAYKTFDHEGDTDWSDKIDEFNDVADQISAVAGELLLDNLQDTSARAALRTAGWRPKRNDMHAQAADWWGWDFEAGVTADESGLVFGEAAGNATFSYFGDDSNLVWDQRGYNYMIQQEAKEFLKKDGSQLRLKTTVKKIQYSKDGVKILTDDGCIEADYAICTFSPGVLQNDVVEFKPEIPRWKQEAIDQFAMATYTKIFMQFNESFWDDGKTQYFLYADPVERGNYPLFQSLNAKGFLEGSNIIFATVTGDQAYRVEQQTNEQTEEQMLEVLRLMFPDKKIPKPTAFFYPRWSTETWTFGSYSNWPVGMTLEKHQNMRANIERLWFAGEANSAEFFGYLHGAYTEGQFIGHTIGNIINGKAGDGEFDLERYEQLHGTTFEDELDEDNGWLFPYDIQTGE